ncbi:MAG: response regulator [Chitinophagaceae bacterium]|nr:response regulator [Chitinophagaceae bacterium]MCW5928540.1 response regulator [Chitinophagaceae bacterium]
MRKQILVIDDSRPIRFLLKTILKKDYQIAAVPDGYSAMYYLQQELNQPDLIIVDAELPDMDNWEFIEHLKSSCLYRNIPVIVFSNLDDEEAQMNCIQLGIIEKFTKPFNPVQMIQSVNNILQRPISLTV